MVQYVQPAKAQINVQSDQSLCYKSLEYSMTVKLQTEQHLEFLSLNGGCTGKCGSRGGGGGGGGGRGTGGLDPPPLENNKLYGFL